MMDLKNGILDVNGFTITPETTTKDLDALPSSMIKVEYSRRGNKYYSFVNRVISANGVDMGVDPYFNQDGSIKELHFWPRIETPGMNDSLKTSQILLDASKKWLTGIVDAKPIVNDNESIIYRFAWGKISAMISKDPHYGFVGGEVHLVYER